MPCILQQQHTNKLHCTPERKDTMIQYGLLWVFYFVVIFTLSFSFIASTFSFDLVNFLLQWVVFFFQWLFSFRREFLPWVHFLLLWCDFFITAWVKCFCRAFFCRKFCIFTSNWFSLAMTPNHIISNSSFNCPTLRSCIFHQWVWWNLEM